MDRLQHYIGALNSKQFFTVFEDAEAPIPIPLKYLNSVCGRLCFDEYVFDFSVYND